MKENIFLINELIKGFKYSSVIDSLKFSCYYQSSSESINLVKILKQLLWTIKSIFTLTVDNTFIFKLKNNIKQHDNAINFATINTMDAVHYNKIDSKLTALLKDELSSKGFEVNQFALNYSNKGFTYGWETQLFLKAYGYYILIFFIIRTLFLGKGETKRLVFNNIDKLYVHIVKYLIEFKYSQKELKDNKFNFLITINENWMPQSVILDCCYKLGIPTIIYPHGCLNPLTLPSKCSIYLFWNERMQTCYEEYTSNIKNNFVIGAIETMEENTNFLPIPQTLKYDVLIISQLSVANDGDNKAYKEIFTIWLAFLEANPSFKICIKLHPFEGEKEFKFLINLFGKLADKISIVQDRSVPISDLIKESKRISTVSSSAIQYSFYYKKPTLVYDPPELVENNYPVPNSWIFRNLEELEAIIANGNHLFSGINQEAYKWVDEREIRKNIKEFADGLI